MKQDARLVSPLARRVKDYERLAASGESNAHLLEKALQGSASCWRVCRRRTTMRIFRNGTSAGRRIREMKDEFRYRFGSELKAALAQQGMELQGSSETESRLYEIVVDFEAGNAGVFWGPGIERIRTRIALSATEIAGFIGGFDAHLKKTEFKPDAFLRILSEAYEQRLSTLSLMLESRVYVVELLGHIAFARSPGSSRSTRAGTTSRSIRESSSGSTCTG